MGFTQFLPPPPPPPPPPARARARARFAPATSSARNVPIESTHACAQQHALQEIRPTWLGLTTYSVLLLGFIQPMCSPVAAPSAHPHALLRRHMMTWSGSGVPQSRHYNRQSSLQYYDRVQP